MSNAGSNMAARPGVIRDSVITVVEGWRKGNATELTRSRRLAEMRTQRKIKGMLLAGYFVATNHSKLF